MSLFGKLADARARRDPAAFAARVLRRESDGGRVALQPFQRDVLGLWSGAERSVLFAFPGAGKTTLAIAWLARELLADPALRAVWVSGSLQQSTKAVQGVARVIESPDTRRIFGPAALPGEPWNSDRLSLAAKPARIRDANLQATSLGTPSVLGSRVDVAILDDVLSPESTATPAGREAAWSSFVSLVLSRLEPGGRVLVMGTAWNRDDLMHRCSALGWPTLRVPVCDEQCRPTWPAAWPAARIQARRQELSAREWLRAYECQPAEDAAPVFSPAAVDLALRRGAALRPEFYSRPDGRVVVGCDVAFSTGPTADLSAVVAVRVTPSGARQVVEVAAGRWPFDALCERVAATAQRHGGSVAVESNGGGGFVAERVRRSVRTRAYATTATSKAWRVEALCAELEQGRWAIPPTDEGRVLARDLLLYSHEGHCGDRLAALLVAVEGMRDVEGRRKVGWATIDMR